jgi:hypothetical protein
MADDTTTDTQTETGPTTAELAARQDSLEGKLDQILGILGKDESKAQGKAQEHEEAKLDAPTSVADEIRRQLEDRDAKERAAKDAAAHEEWRAGVDQKLGGLAEQKPEPPQRKIEKVMGWR